MQATLITSSLRHKARDAHMGEHTSVPAGSRLPTTTATTTTTPDFPSPSYHVLFIPPHANTTRRLYYASTSTSTHVHTSPLRRFASTTPEPSQPSSSPKIVHQLTLIGSIDLASY
ncbi:hypothetical protein BC629DRAFT_1598341 [Irpex lacteus]|nr:hypothetical protein BC629DRAFT_1598341 [Irpex lacteus]